MAFSVLSTLKHLCESSPNYAPTSGFASYLTWFSSKKISKILFYAFKIKMLYLLNKYLLYLIDANSLFGKVANKIYRKRLHSMSPFLMHVLHHKRNTCMKKKQNFLAIPMHFA